MEKKIKMAYVGFTDFPIPAIRGGAIERDVTRTMDLNERFQLYDLSVITIRDKGLDSVVNKYKYCKIIQIEPGWFLKFVMLAYRFLRKLSGYKLPLKTAYMHQVNKVLKKEKYDVIQFSTSHKEIAQLDETVKSTIIFGVSSDYLTMQSYGIEKILRRVDYYAAGPYLKERMMAMLGLTEDRFLKSTYSIDSKIDDISLRLEIRKNIREKHGIGQDDLIMLYVGRLSPEKGALQLIEAMQSVDNCRLIIVGGANFSSNEQTDYVKALYAAAEKCINKVLFTGYIENHDDVRKYMYAADMACVPSIGNEAGSVALLEFRVCSLPTIISDKGGMKYHAGENVITVTCDDHYVDNLNSAIRKLCSDASYRKQLADSARNGLENHTPEASFKKRFEVISSIIRNKA